MADAVPSVGRWREAGLPQFPARPQIERLLASCDRSRLVGARDFAILMLLARLGLRTVEVCRLEHLSALSCSRLAAVRSEANRRDLVM